MTRSGFSSSFWGAMLAVAALVFAATAVLTVKLYEEWSLVPGTDVFDPATHAWSARPTIDPKPEGPSRRGSSPLGPQWMKATFPDGTAVAVTHAYGGDSPAGRSPSLSSMQWYDGQHWSSLGELERGWLALWAAQLDDGTIVMADSGSSLIFHPRRGTMRSVAAPPLAVTTDVVLVAAGDRVYATTTSTDDGIAVLGRGDDTWTPLPPCPTRRQRAVAQGLTNGSLVLGYGFVPAHVLRTQVLPTLIMIVGIAALVVLGSLWAVVRGRHWGGIIGGIVAGVVLGGFISIVFAAAVSVEGRPLRLGRRAWRGRVRSGVERRTGSSLAWPVRRLLAHAWARDAALEHASVAAFEQLAGQLEAVGAPEGLVARARGAAVEEAEHTRLCLALAERYAERELRLAPLPVLRVPSACEGRERQALLVRLAVESFVDGTIGEGFAAAAAAETLTEVTDPEARRTLEIIARDEASHAAHARDVVAWCEAEGGEPVREAVRRVTARERRRARHRGLPVLQWTDALAQHGRFREARPGALDAALRARL